MEKLPKELPAHMSLRRQMKWKNADKTFTSINLMSKKEIQKAKFVLEEYSSDGKHIWNGYSKDAWTNAFQMEFMLREILINQTIKNNFKENFPCTKEGRLIPIKEVNSNENVNRLLRRLVI